MKATAARMVDRAWRIGPSVDQRARRSVPSVRNAVQTTQETQPAFRSSPHYLSMMLPSTAGEACRNSLRCTLAWASMAIRGSKTIMWQEQSQALDVFAAVWTGKPLH